MYDEVIKWNLTEEDIEKIKINKCVWIAIKDKKPMLLSADEIKTDNPKSDAV